MKQLQVYRTCTGTKYQRHGVETDDEGAQDERESFTTPVLKNVAGVVALDNLSSAHFAWVQSVPIWWRAYGFVSRRQSRRINGQQTVYLHFQLRIYCWNSPSTNWIHIKRSPKCAAEHDLSSQLMRVLWDYLSLLSSVVCFMFCNFLGLIACCKS